MQQGAGKNIPFDYPFVWGWKQNFRVTINHKNDNGSIRSEPLLTNIKFIIYNNKTALQIKRSFQLTGNEGITFDNNAGTVTINIDHNTPEILPVGQYFYMIEYHRTGLGIEQVYSGSFFVSVDGDCNCDILDYVSQSLEIANVNGLREELDGYALLDSNNDFTGNLIRKSGFLKHENEIGSNAQIDIWIDVVNGIDNLPHSTYEGATSSTTANINNTSGNKFLTFEAAVRWINQSEYQRIVLWVQGTNFGNPINVINNLSFRNKGDVTIRSFPLGLNDPVYFNITGSIDVVKSTVKFNICNITLNADKCLTANARGDLWLSNTTINYGSGITLGLDASGGNIDIDTRCVFNVGANNQNLFHSSGSYGGTVHFNNHSVLPVFNLSTFTGINFSTLGYNLEAFMNNILLPNIPAGINMSNTLCNFAGSIMARVNAFNSNMVNYALNLGTLKPIRTTDVNSNTASNTGTKLSYWSVNELGEHLPLASEWTTGTRPASPRLGHDGWNSTLSSREYWNGTIWKSY